MLVAIDRKGQPTPAANAIRGAEYRCDYCQELLAVHKGLIRIHHYAHYPGCSDCPGAAPESAAHMEMKWYLYKWLETVPGITRRAMEHRLGGRDALRRADVWAETRAGNIAFECQVSPLTAGTVREKLNYPANTRVFWLMVIHHSVLDLSDLRLADLTFHDTRVPAWVQELHTMYAGRVYVYQDAHIYPVHLDPMYGPSAPLRLVADLAITNEALRCGHGLPDHSLAWFAEVPVPEQLARARADLVAAQAWLEEIRASEKQRVIRAVLLQLKHREIAAATYRVERLERAVLAVAPPRTARDLQPSTTNLQPPAPTPSGPLPHAAPSPPAPAPPATLVARPAAASPQPAPKPPAQLPTPKSPKLKSTPRPQPSPPKARPKPAAPAPSDGPIRQAFLEALRREADLDRRWVQMCQEATHSTPVGRHLSSERAAAHASSDAALTLWCASIRAKHSSVDPVVWCTRYARAHQRALQAYAALLAMEAKPSSSVSAREAEAMRQQEAAARLAQDLVLDALEST